jgi:hypothetical protein
LDSAAFRRAGKAAKAAPKDTEKQWEITDAMKAFRTTELQIPDIVGLSSILTQKLTHFHV